MKYSENLNGMIKSILGINPDITNIEVLRIAIENHLDYIKKVVLDPIGNERASGDIKLVCEEVNSLYIAKALYNRFMKEYEEFLNQEELKELN